MEKDGKKYLLYIFLKDEFKSKEFNEPIVAFFCFDGKLYPVDLGECDYEVEEIDDKTLSDFLSYIEDVNNLYSQEYDLKNGQKH